MMRVLILFLLPLLAHSGYLPKEGRFNCRSAFNSSNEKDQLKKIFNELSNYRALFKERDDYFLTRLTGVFSNSEKKVSREVSTGYNMAKIFNVTEKPNFQFISEKNWTGALKKIPEIQDFVKELDPKSMDYEMNQSIFSAILLTFSKHLPEYLKGDSSNKDFGKINKMLDLISSFDVKNGEFFLYKIKRTIEEKNSLRDWLLCK